MKKLFLLFFVTAFCAAFTSIQPSTFENVFESPQIIEIGATLKFNHCNNKAYVPIDLPSGASGFIYSISGVSKSEIKKPQSQLLNQVKELATNHEPSKIADFIRPDKKSKHFSLYILPGKENTESFFNCGCYKYIEKHENTKARSGYIKNTYKDTIFIGIEGVHDLSNLRLKIEVVAVM